MEPFPLAKSEETRSGFPLKCSTCPVLRSEEWADIDDEKKRLLDRTRRVHLCRRGDTLFLQGDEPQGIYCVQAGYLLLWRGDYFGNETAFDFAAAGDCVGYRSFFAQDAHSATARALTPSRICLIPGATIHHLLDGNASLTQCFLRLIARDRGPSNATLLRSGHLPVYVRLIRLLLILGKRCASNSGGPGFELDLPLTRRDMAALIDVRPETLSRALGELRDEGLAISSGRHFVVPDCDRLIKATGALSCTERG